MKLVQIKDSLVKYLNVGGAELLMRSEQINHDATITFDLLLG